MPTPPPAAAMAHTPFAGPLSVATDTESALALGLEPSGWANIIVNDRTVAGFYTGSEEENVARAEYAVRAVNSHAALVEALEECRATLAMMVDPAAIAASNVQHAAAKCIAAEAKARAALALATAGGAG